MGGKELYALPPISCTFYQSCYEDCVKDKGGEGARILVTTFHRADK